MAERQIMTVTQLNEYIKGLLDSDGLLYSVAVTGELSNYKVYPSGHHYFTVKDENSALRCVMFKGNAMQLRFRPESGMKVIAAGRVSVFTRDGAYQLYVTSLTPAGVGDLAVAFEQLKEKLNKEGLFAREHKKPIPRYPMRIGVITSSAGAAVHDIIRVLRKRWPLGKIILLPVRVQGAEAPPEIVGAIRYADRHQVADVLIVGRGGGSIEDLWCFNDERVARAIYDCSIPVISAVGHEPDVTISDFVADLRAATPSNGAELCAPDRAELLEYLDSAGERCWTAVMGYISHGRQILKSFSEKRVLRDPKNYVEDKKLRLDSLRSRLENAAALAYSRSARRFEVCAGRLDALSPLKVLSRGYAIAMTPEGRAVKSGRDVNTGERISVRLMRDSLVCTVDEIMEAKDEREPEL
ncbi:MAG: exodeoxyribonuclease VII large subunit [Oscillospiraceae bacterium]|nr:exodeoxyribonuclease VII large subunit [Oscillospiraceae bacterium]